jgi:hypothetical protein
MSQGSSRVMHLSKESGDQLIMSVKDLIDPLVGKIEAMETDLSLTRQENAENKRLIVELLAQVDTSTTPADKNICDVLPRPEPALAPHCMHSRPRAARAALHTHKCKHTHTHTHSHTRTRTRTLTVASGFPQAQALQESGFVLGVPLQHGQVAKFKHACSKFIVQAFMSRGALLMNKGIEMTPYKVRAHDRLMPRLASLPSLLHPPPSRPRPNPRLTLALSLLPLSCPALASSFPCSSASSGS